MAAASAVDTTWNGAGRLRGVDLARGLAVLGMLAAHLLDIPEGEWSRPETWGDIVNGRSSILFATLAGVSIGLVSGGPEPLATGPRLRRVRWAIGIRAALLWLIGMLLIATGVPVYVILPAYAVLFLLALPLLRWRARRLWTLAAGLAFVMPWLQPAFAALPVWDGDVGEEISLAVGWHYPVTVWVAFLVAGLALARSDLTAARTQLRTLGAGAVLAAVGYGVAATTSDLGEPYLAAVLTARPHSSGLGEVIGSGGFALAVIAGCQLLCRSAAASAVALPLRAVGSMPLTAYAGQIIVWALVAAIALGDVADLGGMRDLQPFGAFALGTVAFCTAWAVLLGRGPLETALAVATRWLMPHRVRVAS